jgi:hypothetical protein
MKSYHFPELQEAINHKPTIEEQIFYIKENRVGLQEAIEQTDDIKKTSKTIAMLRAIEENLEILRIQDEAIQAENKKA